MNQKQVFELIKSTSGQARVLTVSRLILDKLNSDFPTALMLSQLIYWSDKGKHRDGYIYKSDVEWHKEIGTSRRQAGRARKKLSELKLIETIVKRANGAPTVHYKLKEDELVKWIVSNGAMDLHETGQSLTEITTEITTEKIITDEEAGLYGYAVALADVCRLDIKVVRGRLFKRAKALLKAGYTIQNIRDFERWWYKNDWRGQKGQPPNPELVIELLKRSLDSTQPIVPPPVTAAELEEAGYISIEEEV